MDLLSNLFKKSKSKNMPPQKQAETCDNQNKNAHLFDMESSFLQNSVMIPAEFDSNQNSALDGSNNSNQENQKPRYSILTTFDPIIKKETDEVKLLESCNESLLNANVLNKTGDFSKTFLSPVTEDFVEKTVEVEVATTSSSAIELNRSSSANTSTQSDNSVLNNTVILNKSLAVENITPDQSLIDANRSCTVTESDLPLTNLNDSDLNNEQNLNTTDQTFVHGSSKVSLNLSTTLKQSDISVTNSAGSHLNTPEQSFVDGSPASFNESSTLKPDASFGNSSNITEQNYYTASENNISVDGSNKSLDVSFTSTQKPNEETAVITSQDIKTVIGHLKIKDDEYESASSNVSDSFIDSFATKLKFSPGVSEKTEINDIYSDKNEQIETEVNETKIEKKDEKYINADSEILNAQIETTVNESKIEDKNKRDLNTSEEILNEQIEIVGNETKIENRDEVTVDLENKNEINSTKVFCDIEIPHEISVDSEKFVNDLNVTNILSDEKVPVIPDEISVESVKIVNDLNNTNILSDEKVIPDEISLEAEKIVNDLNNTNILSDKKEIPDEISLEAEKLVKDLNKTNILSDEKVIPDEISLEAEKLVKDLNKTNFSSDEKVSEISDDIGVESVKILNDLNKTNISSSEKVIPNEISLESEKIVKDLNNTNISSNEQVFVIPDEIRVEQVKIADDNKSNISSDEKVSTLETVTDKNISFEINTNNLQEKLSETANKEYIKECSLENKNVSFEVINTSLQTVDALIENNKEEILKEICPTQSLNSTYENKSVIDTVENLTPSSTLVAEETHMSASEPNSGVNEPTVANRLSVETNAACTNEMGEIINPNECFEKQLDITNGAIDNKESLEAKARVYNEMAEKYALVEAECEKFKVQVADLKKELKSCRQKSVALEAEVADLKRKENELNVLLEEYKQSTASKGDAKEDDAQLKRLQASEEALKNEVKELTALVNQHESRLKELQRKEVKLADDLTSKTQSEMQISRVMEEYEKSLSSLISDNEKMKKERDTAQMHLANIEMAFSDVHQKYERCKAIVQGYKDNEESYKQDIAMNRETIVIQEQKYESLKAHAMKQLEISNQELATMKKQHETEMARLTAQLKRYEIKTQSLMESLQQKAKECEQLSAVCDEFIGNV